MTDSPVEGQTWEHPLSRAQYRVHSVTEDGWTRYYAWRGATPADLPFPIFTQPTERFAGIYRKVEGG